MFLVKKYLALANRLDISNPKVLLKYLHNAGIVGYYEELSNDVVILQLLFLWFFFIYKYKYKN